ncbi:lactoylglutathione lyase [Suttonella sp. R2A3]|uniref:lactoylglutathione lyase n=1 Tax=Suttonella sp. R2A3 TaxID=2908648 RepID=UPI001F42C586|nr:lactoylglutathione lyase [Suttonella sp. R2A3]UJF24135.1 lactoylglutathione lyase [Suttonella sp. R2A3]
MAFQGEQHPGVTLTHDEHTQGFTFNHTMLRIKDPKVSLDFYTRIMGMTVVRKDDYPNGEFSLYFLARLNPDEQPPEDKDARKQWVAKQRGILELTHNWGTENEASFHYHDGNAQPQGFGHICFSVPDFEAAIAYLDSQKVTYKKRPEDGSMRDIAFIKDPDGYWIEIIGH